MGHFSIIYPYALSQKIYDMLYIARYFYVNTRYFYLDKPHKINIFAISPRLLSFFFTNRNFVHYSLLNLVLFFLPSYDGIVVKKICPSPL